jgi:Asp-tRNA(Asn)/Glu-tRNA(Gln) amidotransferase A subunit family amidase
MGLQLWGPARADRDVLAAAAAYEQVARPYA